MFNNKIILILILLGFMLMPFTFAQDNSNVTGDDNSYSNVYFNASLADDSGDGSKENPYKYLSSNRISSNSNLYFADGVYELDSSKAISSNNSFIGQNMENTIITYKNSDYIFSNSGVLGLYNLTIKSASIYNTGILKADNVIFKDSSNPNYGGSIFSYSSTLEISNSFFINNTAKMGGAICDLNSHITLTNINAINNSAVYQGGAIYKMYGNLNLSYSNFFNNSAKDDEGIFCDYSEFSMAYNNFNKSNVYSAVNRNEDFFNNTFIQCELYKLDYYDINFERSDYLQMIYNAYNGTLPSRYDLRDYGWVSSVKNQGSDGNCWAFAGIAALESCILKATGIEYDFSEENMKNLMAKFSDYGWNMSTNNGGYNDMALGYFSSWMGPVNDSDDKYVMNTVLSPLMDSIMHVQNIIYLPRFNYTDNDGIKNAILNYGAVFTGIYYNNAYYRNTNYYNYAENSQNHAIVIVGWDDNYSKNNFRKTPPGNGAWICKNSWGENYGNKGYFYVSYYDISCARLGVLDGSFTFILNDTVKYDKNYQYDVIGITDYLLTNQSNIWYQNIFKASSDDIIAAFSTYFNFDSNYTVDIFVNDELRLTQEGSSPAGYFTINLDDFIPVYKNDLFKVVIKLNNLNEAWVPISEKVSATRTHYYPNISFISYDGVNWIDLYDYVLNLSERGHTYNSAVACIKAFTIFNLTTTTLLNEVSRDKNNINLTATVKDQYGHLINEGYVIFEYDNKKYNRSLVNGIATLSLKDYDRRIYNIMAIYENNSHYLSSYDELTLDLQKTAVNLTLDVGNIYSGEYFTVNATLLSVFGDLIDSYLMLTIGDKSYNISSNSVFTVPDLFNAGNYTVNVYYEGDYTYHDSKTSLNVIVSKKDVILTFDIGDIYYGGNFIVNTSLTSILGDLMDSSLVLTIGNRSYNISSNHVFIVPDLFDPGNYDVSVYYKGSNIFNESKSNLNVTVNKNDVDLDVNVNDITYGEYLTFDVSLSSNSKLINENVILNIDGVNYTFNANNKFTLPILLNASKYDVCVYYKGDKVYNSKNIIKTVNVSKTNPTLVSKITDVKYGEDITVAVNLTGINDSLLNENVILSINNINYTFNANNNYNLSIKLNASVYNAKVVFEGNNNYNKIREFISFVVDKSDVELTLAIENITYGDNLIINNTINHDILVKINSKTFSIKENSIYKIPDLFDAGDYQAAVIFEGNNNYNNNTQIISFSVHKFTPQLNLNIPDINYGDYILADVGLNGINNSKLNENVILTVNKNSFSFKAGDIFIIPVLFNASSYGVDVIFKGNANYNSVSDRINVNVNKVNPKLILNISDINYGDYILADVGLNGINNSKLNENVILTVNKNSFSFKAGDIFIIPVLFNASSYTVDVIFKGNANYNSVSDRINVNVNKVNPKLILNISDTYYANDLVVNNYLTGINQDNINESLILSINNKKYNVNSNSEYLLTDILDVGRYTAFITFNGNNNYNKATSEISFNINLIDLDMNLTVNKNINNVSLSVKLSDSINDTINVRINNQNFNIKNGDILNLNNLDLGQYFVEAVFNKTGYKTLYIKDSFTVDSINTLINANNIIMHYHDGTSLTGVLMDSNANTLSNKSVSILINGVKYTRNTDSEGVFSINLGLNSGLYPITLEFNGDANYINSSKEILVDIKSSIDSNGLIKYHRNASQFHATVLDYGGKPVINTDVIMNINGVFYTRTTDSQGIVSLNINLSPGNYILTLYNPSTGENRGLNITVLSRLVENHDLVKYYKNASRYSVKLLDEKGSPLSGAYITFNINGVFYERQTDSDGIASLAINLEPNDYIITAYYGDAAVSNSIKVLSTIKSNDIVMNFRDGTQFKATILDGVGISYPNQKVIFNVNGVFYTRITDSNGVAVLNINLQAGKYIITSSYNGLNVGNTITINNI